jgi:hypothetical protein
LAAIPYYEAYLGLNSALQQSDNSSFAFASANSSKRIDLFRHQDITVGGAPGETVTLDLGRFLLHDRSTFTLHGTAATTFIIRVRNQFALTKASKVILAGGVQWDDVVFRIHGKGDTVYLNKKTSLEGTVIANQRTVRLGGHSTISGQVIAKNVLLTNASQIVGPPIVSP